MNDKVTYRGAQTGLAAQCEAVLRTVPQWFGREDSLREYVEKIAVLDTYSAWKGNELIGFISVYFHNQFSAELYVLAVKAAYHRLGIGTHLYKLVEEDMLKKGMRFIQVKTVAESLRDKNYEKTRKFYTKIGFLPLEEFDELWDADTPCLQMVKSI